MLVAPIVLLTDFGTEDAYVGIVKGVIAGIAPEVQVIDLTHEVPPGNIRQGAFQLWQSVPYFPRGTIFLAVVDPGVGTARRPIAVAWQSFTCVGPDNGLFTYLLAQEDPVGAHIITSATHRLPTVSSTFHGRDVFAPAAAHLARGEPIGRLGPPASDLVRFPLPLLELAEGPEIRGEILHADHFGNWITSLGVLREDQEDLVLEPWLPGGIPTRLHREGCCVFMPDGSSLALRTTFGDAAVGQALAYIGSTGLLEIAVNGARAADVLPVSPGQCVRLGHTSRKVP